MWPQQEVNLKRVNNSSGGACAQTKFAWLVLFVVSEKWSYLMWEISTTQITTLLLHGKHFYEGCQSQIFFGDFAAM